MNVLVFINTYIRYAYLAMTVVLIAVIVDLLRKTGRLNVRIEPLNEEVRHINESVEELNEKMVVIEQALKDSLPFFITLFFVLSILNMAFRDYFRTKYSKRDFGESLHRAYRYKSAMRELSMLKRASGR